MAKRRKIKLVLTSSPAIEGAGVHLNRVFGFSDETLFDPFLLLDDFRSDEPDHYLQGFPWHPHRGIETITYVLKGDVEHGDSLGNSGIVSSGDVQWMTAGSGIIHQEMPKGDPEGAMYGFQLWANLPARDKMMHPRYRDVKKEQIPEIQTTDGVRIRIIAGSVNNVTGPVTGIVTAPEYLDCSVSPGTRFQHSTRNDYTTFIYVIGGDGRVEGVEIKNGMLVLFDEGDEIMLSAGQNSLRFLLCSGKPLKEPVAWRGPIVMNSEAELDQAFEEFHAGTFIKHTSSNISGE
jgi:redox-sensitive bicupin YhaK (pirin superfamily)